MVENGLYKIKDEYFSDFPHANQIRNKDGRPFYYALKDNLGIFWLIPLSSQVDNYRRKIEAVESKRGKGHCINYHIGLIAGKERVFKVCDMVPVTTEYIADEFYINSTHYIVKNKTLVRELSEKSRNFIKQMELGRMRSQIDALSIRDKLISDN